MRTKDLRDAFDELFQNAEPVTASGFTDLERLRGMVGNIILYLEEREAQPPVYVPEPRLGPRPESKEEAIERGRQLGEIIRVAREKLEATREENYKTGEDQNVCQM